MKNCGRSNVRKHKEIKGSDNYVTLYISSKFDSLNKMKIISSESKGELERSGKGLVAYMGFKTKARSQKYKKSRYFCGLTLALKPREVINPSPNLSNFPFDSEDVIFILYRLSNFNEMSKVTYLSLPLISLCFLTLQRAHNLVIQLL